MKKLCTYLCILAPIMLQAQAWIQVSDKPGAAIRGACSFVLNEEAYVVGGFNGSVNDASLLKYSPNEDSWSQLNSIPQPMRYGASFSVDGKGYVVGGIGSAGHSNQLWEYDPDTDTWQSKAQLPGPGRYGVFSFVIDDIAYVGCGNSGSALGPYHNSCYRYSAEFNAWIEVASLPALPSFGATGFSYDGYGYVVGGTDVNGQSSALWQYDADLDAWTEKEAYPNPVIYQSTLSTTQGVIVAGGPSPNSHEAYQYIPANDQWYFIPPYLGGASYTSVAFTINDRYFIGLGYDSSTSDYYNDLWELKDLELVGLPVIATLSFEFFPNPFSHQATVRFKSPLGPALVRLYSIDGRLISSVQETYIDVQYIFQKGELSVGQYFLQFDSQTGVFEKLISID